MSFPNDDQNMTPLFAYLLVDDEQMTPANTSGGGNPTTYCVDNHCTKKYPSDQDDCSTWKNGCDEF